MSKKKQDAEIGDILVVLMKDTKKRYSGEVVSRNKNHIRIEVADNYGETDTHDLKIGEDSVILTNLGDSPLSGTVYKCKIRKLHHRTHHDFWGAITFFRELDDDEKDSLKFAMKKSYDVLKKLGLHKIIRIDNLLVQDASGRYAGWYKQDRYGNHICYQPKEIERSTSALLMHHEVAHAIWFQTLKASAQAKWVHLYNEYTQVTKTPEDTLVDVIGVVAAEPRRLADYYDLVTEIEFGDYWLDALVDALLSIHLFDKDDLDLYLWSLSNKQRGRALERAALNVTHLTGEHAEFPVSKYASKNTKEFFAESYCHYLADRSRVPDTVQELLWDTLPALKNL